MNGDSSRTTRHYFERALSFAKELGRRHEEGRCNGNLGNAYTGLGDFKKAIDYYKQYLSIAKELGQRDGEGSAYGHFSLSRLVHYVRSNFIMDTGCQTSLLKKSLRRAMV